MLCSSWASRAVCVSVFYTSVLSLWVLECVHPFITTLRGVCLSLRPFKTHADQPQLHDASGHLTFNLSSVIPLCLFFQFYFLCLWPSPPTPGCPIFLIATFCHSNSAQQWVALLCQLRRDSTSCQAQINKSQCFVFLSPRFTTEDIISVALLSV